MNGGRPEPGSPDCQDQAARSKTLLMNGPHGGIPLSITQQWRHAHDLEPLDPVAGRVIEGAVAVLEGFARVTGGREAMQSLNSGCTDGSRATNYPSRQ